MSADAAAGFIPSLRLRHRSAPRRPLSLRLLYAFWGAVIVSVGVGAGVLQWLGPPDGSSHFVEHDAVVVPNAAAGSGKEVADHVPVADENHTVAAATAPAGGGHVAALPAFQGEAEHGFAQALPPVAPAVPPAPLPPRPSGSVARPDAGLMELSALYAGGKLPRIGADRRTPMQAYASPFNATDPRPRVAVLLGGIGMNEAESLAAMAALPAAISLAVSPYAFRPEAMLDQARNGGHEFLVSIPMEPLGYPLNDPGNRALLTGATEATNAQRLEWVLSRFGGYVGATGALGTLRGERFAAATDQMAPVLDTLADRGLLYVDPRPNVARLTGSAAQRGAGRGVDIVLDEPPGRTDIDQKLAQLEQAARDRGSALGIAGRPTPVTIARIAAWASSLATRGIALAPVSVVVQMPRAANATATPVRTNLLK